MNSIFKNIFKNPYIIISTFIFFALLSALATVKNLTINTSTDSLISNELKFKKNHKQLKKNFNILNNNILIRIKGDNVKRLKESYYSIIESIKSLDGIDNFYSPNFDIFFRENFFSFLTDKQKEDFVNELFTYQPFLSELNNKPKLKGFNDFLELIIKSKRYNDLENLEQIFKMFLVSVNEQKEVVWTDSLKREINEIFILVSINDFYLEENGFAEIYKSLISIKNQESNDELIVQFTGGLIIDHEEVGSVSSGVTLSGIISLILVALILFFTLKKAKLIFSLIISIIVGLIITTGLTSVTVGSLNLISVAFAVLFIGLSVDFGIQVFSRIIESSDKDNFFNELKSISRTICIAAVPSIIGFLSFVPTEYLGLSELGIISAIGLIVGLMVNTIFLPAMFIILYKDNKASLTNNNSWEKFLNFVVLRKNYFFFLFIFIIIFDVLFFRKIDFETDAMKVKDQNLQSVKLAKELIEKNPTSDYVISIILEEKINSEKLKKLVANEHVKKVNSIESFFEEYNSENLEYLKFLLQTNVTKKIHSDPVEITRFLNLLQIISELELNNLSNVSNELYIELTNRKLDLDDIKKIETLFFIKFNDLTKTILSIGEEKNFLKEQIPQYFIERFESSNNFYRFEVIPSKDVTKNIHLKEFVRAVQSFYPDATGMPVVQLEAGKVVISSFIKAFIFAFIGTFFYLLIIFRKAYKIILTISSLFVAFFLLIFLMIIFKINLNFANMIALPLLFSLGISYPIYMVSRYSEKKNIYEVFRTKTPTAILASCLTTVASFGTLYFSSHDGTSSMGLLLFISLLTTLFSSLIYLPIVASIMKSK